MTWSDRPADLDKPGHIPRGDEWELVLDRLAALSPMLNAYKLNDTARNTTTTYADDPDLFVPVDANGVYAVQFNGHYQAHASGGLQIRFAFPSGTLEVPQFFYDSGGTIDYGIVAAGSSPIGSGGFPGTSANLPMNWWGTLFVGTTGGQLKVQWTQNSSFATNTILRKGCRLSAMKLN